MALQVIRNQRVATEDARRIATLVLSQQSFLDVHRCRRWIQGNGARFRLLKADRNVIAEVRVAQFPVPLMIKYPNGSNSKARKVIAWEAGQWRELCAAVSQTEEGVLPALLAFDEEASMLFLEKLNARTAYQAMIWSPLLNLFPSAKQRTLAAFWKLGKLLAALHANSASASSPQFYTLEAKVSSARCLPGLDPIFDRGWEVFWKFYAAPRNTQWVHGNLRTDNVLFTRSGVALIDLENAGAGDPIEDFGRLLAFVLMFRRFEVFPRSFWVSIVDQLVRGYGRGAEAASRCLVACILGEMLLVYGRDAIPGRLQGLRARFKRILAGSIGHLVSLLTERPDAFHKQPAVLVAG